MCFCVYLLWLCRNAYGFHVNEARVGECDHLPLINSMLCYVIRFECYVPPRTMYLFYKCAWPAFMTIILHNNVNCYTYRTTTSTFRWWMHLKTAHAVPYLCALADYIYISMRWFLNWQNAVFETALKTCNNQYFCDGVICAAVGAKTVRKLIGYKQVTGGSNESNLYI